MRRVPWNTCTSFAAAGTTLAYAILISAFGWHWQLIPGGISGLVAAYAVSTMMGGWLARIGLERHFLLGVFAGVGAALLTLFAGCIALTVTNFIVWMAIEVSDAPSGQPFLNAVGELAPSYARDFVIEPVLAGLLYGQVPSIVLGVIYGVILASRTPDAKRSPVKGTAPVYLASGIGVALVLVVGGTTMSVITRDGGYSHVPVGVPVAIGGCSSSTMPNGVLAYCEGSPCEEGYCDWDSRIDAIAVYVRGPENKQWRHTGGGIGNTSSPHVVRHNMWWVQPGSDGSFDESNPHRFVRYEFWFDRDNVVFREQSFEFKPGMLFVVRYSDDWSYAVSVGREALENTDVTFDQLQRVLDETCEIAGCRDRGFQISE